MLSKLHMCSNHDLESLDQESTVQINIVVAAWAVYTI